MNKMGGGDGVVLRGSKRKGGTITVQVIYYKPHHTTPTPLPVPFPFVPQCAVDADATFRFLTNVHGGHDGQVGQLSVEMKTSDVSPARKTPGRMSKEQQVCVS